MLSLPASIGIGIFHGLANATMVIAVFRGQKQKLLVILLLLANAAFVNLFYSQNISSQIALFLGYAISLVASFTWAINYSRKKEKEQTK